MKKIVLLAMVFSVTAFAQENKNDINPSDGTPVAVNRFVDNWFVGAGAGVNTILDNGFLGKTGLGLDVTVGKWLVPGAGFRFGYHGLSNQALDTSNGWFAGEDKFGYHFIHADIMWDIMNSFRYNEKRLLSVVAMLQGGYILTTYKDKTFGEFGYGAALQLGFRAAKRIRITAEASATLAREEAWRKAGTLICYPSLTAGVQVAVGRVGFKPKVRHFVTVERVVDMIECNHDSQIADLKAEIDSLKNLAQPQPVTMDGMVTYFVINKAELLERERYHLIDLVSILPKGASLTLVGHADKETGSKRRNETLSKERVEAVYSFLRKQGFQGEIKTDFKGDTANPFEEPFPKNRCVTIAVTIPAK